MVLLDTGSPGTSREIFSENANGRVGEFSMRRNTVVLLDTGPPGTSREIFSEDANGGVSPSASSLKIFLLVLGVPVSSRTTVFL